jgi:hypothetical protein
MTVPRLRAPFLQPNVEEAPDSPTPPPYTHGPGPRP